MRRNGELPSLVFNPPWPTLELEALQKNVQDLQKAAQISALLEHVLGNIRSGYTVEEGQQAVQTVLTYLSNVLHSDAARFRKIGLRNSNFRWKVQSIDGAVELLIAAGFRLNKDKNSLELESLDQKNLTIVVERLQKELIILQQQARELQIGLRGIQGTSVGQNPVEPRGSLRFQIGYADIVGRRPTMEDQNIIRGVYRGHPDEDFFGLFDGHGGKAAATLAAITLHSELWKCITLRREKVNKQEDEDVMIRKVVRESFLSTNLKLCQSLNLIHDPSGTTVLMTWIIGNKIVVANAGDSRAALYKDSGRIVRLSKDHRPEDPEEKRRIETLGGCVITLPEDSPRLNGRLSVSRGFGDCDLQPYFSPEPFINIVPLTPDDRYLILGCDGLWDELTEEQVANLITKWRERKQIHARATADHPMLSSSHNSCGSSNRINVQPWLEPHCLARWLVEFSYASGSPDNISVIIVQLKD